MSDLEEVTMPTATAPKTTRRKKTTPPSLFDGMDLAAFGAMVAKAQKLPAQPAAGPRTMPLADVPLGAYGEVSSMWGPDGSREKIRVGWVTKPVHVYTGGISGDGPKRKYQGQKILSVQLDVTGSCIVGGYAPLDATFTVLDPPAEHAQPRTKLFKSYRTPAQDLLPGQVFYIWDEMPYHPDRDTRRRYHVQAEPVLNGDGTCAIHVLIDGETEPLTKQVGAQTWVDIVDPDEWPWQQAGAAAAAARRADDGLDDVREVLAAAAVDSRTVRLAAKELPRPVWEALHALLTGMGATGGSRKGQPYRFEIDRSAELRAFIVGGPAPRHERTTKGWVPTPDALAADVIGRFAQLASVPEKGRMLEPSAGQGALIRAVVAVRPDLDVTAVEPVDERAAQLEQIEQAAGLVYHGTFEDYEKYHHQTWIKPYDLIVMNPPYSMPKRPNVWIEHVKLAWSLLADGGRLVAIVPCSSTGELNAKALPLLKTMGAGVVVEQLPDGSFTASGTGVSTCVIAATRSATPYAGSLFRIPQGEPVEVDKPVLTAAAAVRTPVQTYRDWGGQRVARMVGNCIVCGTSTWSLDDGGNDPRGMLGYSVVYTLVASERGAQGSDVCLCYGCADSGQMFTRGEDRAREVWAWEACPARRADSNALSRAPGQPAPELEPGLFSLESLGRALAKQ